MLAVGDVVVFTITEMSTIFGNPRAASAIADLGRIDEGFDVASLVQDINNNPDVVTNLDELESELVTATYTLVGIFGSAGSGHVSSVVQTAAVVGNPDLLLRIPETLRDALAALDNLAEGCELTVTGPMWRFFSDAQPSTYAEADVTIDSCPPPGISLVRAAPDGPLDPPIAITGAVVTYTRPETGSSDPGFFIQKDQTGPAIFVEIDPATLDPVPAVGDVINFSATEVDTAFGDPRFIATISDYAVASSGFDVASLVQEVSSASDLVSALGTYESELLGLTFTLASGFGSAGSGHVSANIDTAGIIGDPDLLWRSSTAVRDTLAATNNLVETCDISIVGPMWRFFSDAQPSTYHEADVVIISCPPPPNPQVTGATASSPTEVVVSFDIGIDAASITDPGADFSFDPALAVVSASVAGTDVTLRTADQAPGTNYTVTVAVTVTSPLGAGVDAAASTAMFTSLAAGLTISSVDFPVIAHGANLVIIGTGLDDTDEVTIGGETQAFTVDSANSLTLTSILDTTPTGAQDLVVTTSSDSTDPFGLTVIHLVINEVDSDQTGTDSAEFVELDAGAAGVDLTGYVLVLHNGSDCLTYGAVDLAGTTDAGGLLWVGPAGFVPAPQVTFARATNQIQNGADAVYITQGAAADFPVDSPFPAVIIDGMVHDTGDPDKDCLTDALGFAATIDEGVNSMKDTQSSQRCSSGRLDAAAWVVVEPTPGAANTCP